jgi:hypothetical protein
MKEQIKKLIAENIELKKQNEEAKTPPDIIPGNPKKRNGRTYECLLETVRVLDLKEFEVTRSILREYGYGSDSVNKYFRENPRY